MVERSKECLWGFESRKWFEKGLVWMTGLGTK